MDGSKPEVYQIGRVLRLYTVTPLLLQTEVNELHSIAFLRQIHTDAHSKNGTDLEAQPLFNIQIALLHLHPMMPNEPLGEPKERE